MRLARFRTHERPCIGLVADDAVIDIGATIPSLPVDMIQVLAERDIWFDRIAGARDHGPSHDLAQVELLPPIACPRKVLALV